MGTIEIELADRVYHKPTDEVWIVARVDEIYVWPAGWPPGRAYKSDCTLIEKATEKQRETMIQCLRKLPDYDERRHQAI